MSGDNFHFDLTGVPLAKCLDIAFEGSSRKATHWRVEEPFTQEGSSYSQPKSHGLRMVLAWADPKDASWNPFPTPLTAEQVIEMVKAWLSSAPYGSEPDHDGDNGRGWRVYNESWGHVGGIWQAFVAIEPEWIWYGK